MPIFSYLLAPQLCAIGTKSFLLCSPSRGLSFHSDPDVTPSWGSNKTDRQAPFFVGVGRVSRTYIKHLEMLGMCKECQ